MGTVPGFAPALLLLLSTAASVDIDTSDGGYNELRVSISDNIPPDESIIDNIEPWTTAKHHARNKHAGSCTKRKHHLEFERSGYVQPWRLIDYNYVHKCTYHHGSSYASLYKAVYSPSGAADDHSDDCDDEDFDDDDDQKNHDVDHQENDDVDHQEHNTEHKAYASDDEIDDHHHK
ncbi:hypothetical protein V5799_023107 [Amblyomma americanum]|uniref:Secreted protein n=1 Tax=Amblyomma americanum TaxID=6943 RepID=A0AAQ4FIL1_AMBAM